jgi:hypothetical protein
MGIYDSIGHSIRWFYEGNTFWLNAIEKKVNNPPENSSNADTTEPDISTTETPNKDKRSQISTIFSRIFGMSIGLPLGLIYGLVYASVYHFFSLFESSIVLGARIVAQEKEKKSINPPFNLVSVLLGLPGIIAGTAMYIALIPLILIARYLSECFTNGAYTIGFIFSAVGFIEFKRQDAGEFYKPRSALAQAAWMGVALPGTLIGIFYGVMAVASLSSVAVAFKLAQYLLVPPVVHFYKNFLKPGFRVLQEITRMGTPEFNRTRFESNLLAFFTFGLLTKSIYKSVRGKTDLIYDDKKAAYLARYTKDDEEHATEKQNISDAYDKFNAVNREYEQGHSDQPKTSTQLFLFKTKNNILKVTNHLGYHPMVEKSTLSLLLKRYNEYVADPRNTNKSLDAFLETKKTGDHDFGDILSAYNSGMFSHKNREQTSEQNCTKMNQAVAKLRTKI